MEIPANQTSASLTLQFPQSSSFVAVMSDSTGFGTGGTSTIYTVGSGASDCLPTTSSKTDFYLYTAHSTPSQCGSFGISWDGDVPDVRIYGVIPGGQSFDLGAPTTGTGFDWTTNVRQGTQMLFLAVGGNNQNGGSTDVTTVSSGSSNGCINPQSPSSTAGPPAGGVSTAAAPAVGSVTQPGGTAGATGSPGATGTVGATGATGTPGASGTSGATGTQGATGNPGATATGSPGGSPTGTNWPPGSSGNSAASSTRGSGGGTVTGDPSLPAATGNHFDGRRKLNLGAIIGGVLGGLAAIILLILLWLFCARRRRANQDDDSERLISQSNRRRTDLLADVPIMRQNSTGSHNWFRAEAFVPPMSAAEFARRTGGGDGSVDHEEEEPEEYRDYDPSMSSLGHAAVTDSTAAAAMYGALARTPSYSTSGHGHRGSTQLSHSRLSHSRHSHSRSQSLSHSHSHSHNVSHSSTHSPTQSSTRYTTSRSHSRSFSNPFSIAAFTPTSNMSRTRQVTPPTPMSATDPFAAAASRPPPSSWNNQASGSSNAVPRVRPADSNRFGMDIKPGEEEEVDNESVSEGDVVDLPPTYASINSSRRVMNP
ncbi:hypothetical protein FRC07_012682 [Ceratobasidium sp. 392]|nr:hypothetical protein FRC07_012682 [Ceratobasidium sp. 392]